MDWNAQIDIYCERIEPGILAEPLNAISNAAFFIAAFAAFMLARREGVLGLRSGFMIATLTAIGVGSSLFHTLATEWAQLADVLPILIFQIGFILIYSRSVIMLDWTRTIILLVAFVMMTRFFEGLPSHLLNGSLSYAPALIFLGGFGVYHWITGKRERFVLLIASATFIVSLTLRSIDMAVCDALPIGVHYFWHIFNGILLYLCLRGMFLNVRGRL